jgi:hypothetical protein
MPPDQRVERVSISGEKLRDERGVRIESLCRRRYARDGDWRLAHTFVFPRSVSMGVSRG